jgi:hypothetical protein
VSDPTDPVILTNPVDPVILTNPVKITDLVDPVSTSDLVKKTDSVDPATLIFNWIIDHIVTLILIILVSYLAYAYRKSYIRKPDPPKAKSKKSRDENKDSLTLVIIE